MGWNFDYHEWIPLTEWWLLIPLSFAVPLVWLPLTGLDPLVLVSMVASERYPSGFMVFQRQKSLPANIILDKFSEGSLFRNPFL